MACGLGSKQAGVYYLASCVVRGLQRPLKSVGGRLAVCGSKQRMDAAGAGMSEEEQLALALALSATQQQQDPTSNSASPSVYNPVDQSPSVGMVVV